MSCCLVGWCDSSVAGLGGEEEEAVSICSTAGIWRHWLQLTGLLWGFFGGFFGLEWLLLTLFFVCVWMSAWYCKSLEHNLLKNASLPNLTNKSSSCPTSRLGCFLLLLGGSRVKRWPRQSVCSDLRSAWDNAKKSCILGTLSDSWFTSAPYCFTPVPLEFFPGVSQGEGGCRAGPDSWVVFLANSRALPSLPELRLWAGVFLHHLCAESQLFCIPSLLWRAQENTYQKIRWLAMDFWILGCFTFINYANFRNQSNILPSNSIPLIFSNGWDVYSSEKSLCGGV